MILDLAIVIENLIELKKIFIWIMLLYCVSTNAQRNWEQWEKAPSYNVHNMVLVHPDSVKKLHVFGDDLTIMGNRIYRLKNLCEIQLAGDNEGVLIFDSLSSFNNLRLISVSDDSSYRVPNSLFQMKDLRYLFLNNIGLDSLSKDISNLKKLEILGLPNNNLTKVPESILELKDSLKQLILWNNPMTLEYIKELRKKLPNTEINWKPPRP